ncbi:hydroxysteroid 11-beta-dehydrogenase 1-like protein [Octopus sinensis]|uniref:Hydroxysteroid 11-beta-dehydrogenase 1-like protein n=1 Tax=Octopus sinensis TaxID=2607531 RepID=A0A6P7ST08_9MOLL|nr:hydroxysteroid 11-beta-dehydrogenase 1-like protein [Octopus sinensis]XP_036362575.1 hydroxysteroid 11-beta-dehydrogenase 1-like protein [Octopus sinensis]
MWLKLVAVGVVAYIIYQMNDMFDLNDLKGKRVVLTGASTGIGEQMAYHYANNKANLLITARRTNVLQKVIDRCKSLGDPNGNYNYITADMGNLSATENVIKEAEEKMGGIDFLVLNHIKEISLGEWSGSTDNLTLLSNLFDINFKAYVHLASYALPLLEKSGGSIIVVSSIAGKLAQPYLSVYSATKFALDGFFSGLRMELELKKCNVSVTLCVIGLIGTENAVSKLKEFGRGTVLDLVKPARPEDAAMAIIKGGALRQREIYFPYFSAKLYTVFRDLFRGLLESSIKFMYQ